MQHRNGETYRLMVFVDLNGNGWYDVNDEHLG
jgi:hypothetical protein